MKRGLLLSLALVCQSLLFGQLITWELSGAAGNQVSSNSSTNGSGIGVGILQRGAGVTPSAAGGSISSSGWFNTAGVATTLADAVANNEYYEFTLPIQTCFSANITQVSVVVRASATGPNTATLRSSADGFTANLGTISITAVSVLNNIPVTLNNQTGTLTFRLYGYGGTVGGGAPATGGTFRIGTSVVATDNDLFVTGTTTSNCNLTGAGLTNVHCEDNNATASTADDYIWFNLSPAGTCLGTGYNVTVSSGSVLLNGTTPATNVAYGASSAFRLQQGSAGAGNVTVTVTDATTGTCSVMVVVVDPGPCSQANPCMPDVTPPSITCPATQTVSCASGVPAPNPGAVTATDNCGTPTVTHEGDQTTNQTCANRFTVLRTYKATDGAGLTATCVQQIIVNDQTPPALTCPAGTTVSCANTVPAVDISTVSNLSDNCGGTVTVTHVSDNNSNLTCANRFTLTRIYRATDVCGNSATCSQVIIVNDQTPPALTCPGNTTVSCSNNVPASNPALVTGLSDNCGGTVTPSFVGDALSNQTCVNRFTVTRTYRATDVCGNSATCTQTILVNDQTAPTFNESPLPPNQNISCTVSLPIPEMLSGTDNCGGSGMVPNVIWINEFHYDNVGTDVGEFVEIAGTAGLNLSDYQIILYNGNGGVVYNTLTLSGVIDNEGGSGFGAVSFSYPQDGIQNGSPDGIALYQVSNNMVIQFISYEGPFQAMGGPANGIISTDVGVVEGNATPIGASLHLTGTAATYGGFTWAVTNDDSPGTINTGQTIQQLPVAIPAVFMQTEAPGNCAGSRVVTRTWTVTDICGNARTHTQIISVGDDVPPVLTPAPANITIECSDPVPTVPMVIATDLCDPNGIVTGPIWVNEIHYDNVGLDANEFIEIAGRAGVNLAGHALVLYNGGTAGPPFSGGTYSTLQLTGVIPNLNNGFGAIAFFYPQDGIQNGPADGIALVSGGTVLQFLSTEGVITAIGGPANGLTSTDIGVAELGADPAGLSVRLSGNGATYAAFTWNNPAVGTPATPGQINQGQTFPAQPPVGLPVTFTTSTSAPAPNCPFARTITRTWSATDACGNTATHTQTITIRDATPPTVTCPPNFTVNLTINGTFNITAAALGVTGTDNCSAANTLTFGTNSTTVTCANQNSTVPFVSQMIDQCGNVGTCTTQVFVSPLARCVPKILISDPCVCKNNATDLTNGQFGETIKIESLTGKVWTVIAVTGFYSANSPNPPGVAIPLTPGITFTENPVGSGDYFLSGVHIDAIGYTITVRSAQGETLTIGNSCQYPNPSITSDLTGPFCLFSDPITLTGDPGDANIVSQGFTINGQPATVLDPAALGVGQHIVTYTVNGGVAKAVNPTDPGCIQSVSQIINILPTPTVLTCNDIVHVSLEPDCSTEVTPDMILEGSYGCYDDYEVTLTPLPFGASIGNTVTTDHIGKWFKATVKHLVSNNTCWGQIKVEDKSAPILTCENINLVCAVTNYEPAALDALGLPGTPDVEECDDYNLIFDDTWFDLACGQGLPGNPDLSAYIQRVWTATDASGNRSSCQQTIRFKRLHVSDVRLPADITVSCESGSTSPSVTGAPWVVFAGQNFTMYPQTTFCEMNVAYTDQVLPVCDGTDKIIRTWIIYDWCLPTDPFPPHTNPIYHPQIIKVQDTGRPSILTPGFCGSTITTSVDALVCLANYDLPDVIVTDNCSRLTSIRAEWKVNDVPYFENGYFADFQGNNHWDPDTLAVLGIAENLPLGNTTITYIITDDCENSFTCTFTVRVVDNVPAEVACDEFTQVALNVDGMVWVNADVFDDGSNDPCGPVYFKARRMDSNGCQSNSEFHDQVKFCCEDIGDTITVVLRVYDADPGDGSVSLTQLEANANDCMVQVFVEDKIRPTCIAPPHVTVSCEAFDPSLWAYGAASSDDNCCLDEIIHTTNLAQFDTLCNRGTIIRRWTAKDCFGLTNQCTQRVVVNYTQDYHVRFPNDRVVFECDGTTAFGEPVINKKDCELMAISYDDQIFTVVPDACYKIERLWTIINWCTYDPNTDCIYVPNPNPNPLPNASANLQGPTVSPLGTPNPWAPTQTALEPGGPQVNFSTYWQQNANCYQYRQIIKVIDNEDPIITAHELDDCDLTPNDPLFWNNMDFWDPIHGSHDLCEAPVKISITAIDSCSGSNLDIRALLFLDLNGDGDMETVLNTNTFPTLPPGFMNINNAQLPNYVGGQSIQFDYRPVPPNLRYRWALRDQVIGGQRKVTIAWTDQANPNPANNAHWVQPQVPLGKHKIKWFVEDNCGNEAIWESLWDLHDCKPPTVVCLNGLSVNIMPTKMIVLWTSDFLHYGEDNCTPANQLVYSIRKSGTGTGFPVDQNGNPIPGLTWTCNELGTQYVELWAKDARGNASFCETYVIIQDPNGLNCHAPSMANVAGVLKTEKIEGLEDASVEISGSSPAIAQINLFDLTDEQGHFETNNSMPLGGNYTVTPVKDDNPLNGVTTFDLLLISKHILGAEPLSSPYKMIAADANRSGSITTFDIVELRKLILGIYSELPSNTSWRFVDKTFTFADPLNPFTQAIPETRSLQNLAGAALDENFVAVKIGDLNQNAVANNLQSADDRTAGTLLFDVDDRQVKSGDVFEVKFSAVEKALGYQFTLIFNGLEIMEVLSHRAEPGASGASGAENFAVFAKENALTTSYFGDEKAEFSIKFRATADGQLSKMLGVSSRITKAEAYNLAAERQEVALRFNQNGATTVAGVGFELYQNQPNPFVNSTSIGFHLPEAAEATLTIFDETGRVLLTKTGSFAKGSNAISVDRKALNFSGLLFYKVETATDSATRKMMQSR